ncbi:hypothetical protein [Williamsia sp. CHRR-6]|uniref:hypothetical protein n=1 Tax=Williamsia sp. CHRR-6 TaxID=2835871 RepID=UPI001BDB1BC8|nr:hypothetical protein [Williamsia sp. CHRR-6]MBT0568623.1 hypothetical protein [Williamsia sp. CHRR-6]
MSITIETLTQASALWDAHRPHGINPADTGNFPDPKPVPLPTKAQNGVNQILGMAKTFIYVLAVGAALFVFGGMIVGARGRSNFAKDAVSHFPWIFGGIIGMGSIVGLLDMFT